MAPTPKRLRGKKQKSFAGGDSSRVLIENLPAILWTTDLEFRLTSFAGGGLSANGKPAKHRLGQSVALFFEQPETDSKAVDAHFLAAGGERCTFDVELMGRDLQARVEPLRNERGSIIGVVGVAIDNTERRVAQRALRISEQNYRSLIDEAPHAICRCTTNGNLLQVNRAMQEMLGFSEPDLLMRNLQTEIFSDPDEYAKFVEKLQSRKSCHGFEARWLQQGGRAINVSLGGRAVFDSAGRIAYLDFFAENISERKQLEEQLRQAQKMQAVGQLAGGIAHDFNNLLTVIHGQAEMMSEFMPGTNPLYSRLDEIQRAAERATALTRQLLAFSRRQVLQTKTLDLNNVVGNMTQMLARLIGRNIELVFSPDPALWTVKVDPGQIGQVLMNLAVNARDAMLGGGRLTIETHNVRPSDKVRTAAALPLGEHVSLVVRDTGHGMDEATRARIFEPFFTTKQAGKGTGLGLSVVYGVVKQSGGQVRVDSEPGSGTSFTICLPRAEGAAEETPVTTSAEIPRGTETVLVVEDDDAIRHLVADFLRNHGYRVLTAKDGTDAIAVMQSNHEVALLLSDMMMPRMGGREVAAKLRETLPGLKVVLMSGNPEDSPLDDMHFLQKPFSIHSLGTLVRKVLDGEQATASAAATTR